MCIRDRKKSAFDFDGLNFIKENFDRPDKHWNYMQGFDHSFVIDKWNGDQILLPKFEEKINKKLDIPLAAVLFCESSGIEMKMFTNQEAIHFYAADYLDPELGGIEYKGKNGEIYGKNAGICLECQGFPNSINQKGFPSIVLNPGCLLYTSPSPRDLSTSRMPSSA